jgi:DNA-directed RNA polymerase subunit M/transcription elongation factor TFIIS
VSYTPEEMASDEQRRRHQQIRQEVAADLVRGQQQAASTDMFTCARCKQKKCTYYVSAGGAALLCLRRACWAQLCWSDDAFRC